MTPSSTKYGIRFDCDDPNCDIMCWDGDTSTPADLPTRVARQQAHKALDTLWSSQHGRYNVYSALAMHMDLPTSRCHIGMFNKDQCKEVIHWAKRMKEKGSL